MTAALQGRHVQWRAYTEDDNTTLQRRHVQWRAYTEDDNTTLQRRHVQWRAYTEDDSCTTEAACAVRSVHWRWQLHYRGGMCSEERTLKMTAALQRRQCHQHTSNNINWNQHHEAKSKPQPLKRVDIYDLTELTEVSCTSFRYVPFPREPVRFILRVFKLVPSWGMVG
jgi:hypothetical protein